ncbi:MAG: hypothetical protein HY000_18520 [Planctomycetes bacterium]|nr:hypothetical protein [Planctomycetota bacterium]
MTFALLVGLVVLVGVVAVALDRTYVNMAQIELSRAADAAALAAAHHLVHDDQLGGHCDQSRIRAAAQEAACRFASLNLTAGEPTELQNDPVDSAAPDVRIGNLRRVNGLSDELVEDPAKSPDTVEVIARRTSARNNPVGMLLGRLFGVSSAEIIARSQATLDDRVVGFGPVGQVAVPVVPLAILASDSGCHRQATWDQAITQRAGADQFALDDRTGQIVRGRDGIPEIELIGGAHPSDVSGSNVAVLQLGRQRSSATVLRQLEHGFNPSDLAQMGGSLQLGRGGQLTLHGSLQLGSELQEAFRTLRGQPRVWMLFAVSPTPAQGEAGEFRVVGFVGARVVDVRTCENGRLAVRLQPCFVVTRSRSSNVSRRSCTRR